MPSVAKTELLLVQPIHWLSIRRSGIEGKKRLETKRERRGGRGREQEMGRGSGEMEWGERETECKAFGILGIVFQVEIFSAMRIAKC